MPLFNMFLSGISVSLNGHVMLHNIMAMSSLLVVALFFQGDGQGLSADSGGQCSEQSERSLFVQFAIGVLSQPIVILPYSVFLGYCRFARRCTVVASRQPALGSDSQALATQGPRTLSRSFRPCFQGR